MFFCLFGMQRVRTGANKTRKENTVKWIIVYSYTWKYLMQVWMFTFTYIPGDVFATAEISRAWLILLPWINMFLLTAWAVATDCVYDPNLWGNLSQTFFTWCLKWTQSMHPVCYCWCFIKLWRSCWLQMAFGAVRCRELTVLLGDEFLLWSLGGGQETWWQRWAITFFCVLSALLVSLEKSSQEHAWSCYT